MFQFFCVGPEKPHGGRGGGDQLRLYVHTFAYINTHLYIPHVICPLSLLTTGELLTLRVSLECFIASHGAGKSRKTERNGTSVYLSY